MNNFDYKTLNYFLNENSQFLTGARLQKIQQPTRQELIFSIRNQGLCKKFYININPKFFHICFMNSDNEQKRMVEIPKQPPMFCMLLRKYIEGAKISKILQPQNERILEFYFETYNELAEKIYLCLAIELMGKHSNVILYNFDTNMIIGCMHNVGADKSSVREIVGGLPYCYPPKKQNTFKMSLFDLFLSDDKNLNNINTFIDNYFAQLQLQDKTENLRSKLFVANKTKLRKINSTYAKLKKQSGSKAKAEQYRKYADLIMANLYNNNDYAGFIEVTDFETNSLLKINLDKEKTLKENANHFYKLYNKSKTADLKTQQMYKDLEQDKSYIEQIIYSIETSQNINDLLEIQEELEKISPQGKNIKQKKQKEKLAIMPLKLNIDNFTIYIGKNNKQNDFIVSKLSRSDDLWFHIHNCAGSHVLLRSDTAIDFTPNIILQCAKLAKQYSSAKLSSKVGVIYTKAKYLKKPPAANLGYVIYKNEKEIIID